MTVWIDGEPGEAVEVDDRGLQYGDGLFETMAVRAGRIRLLDRHLARLAAGCARLALPCPPDPLLRRELAAAAASPGAGVVKLTLTRGSGPRGYRPPAVPTPRRIIVAGPGPEYPPEFADAGVEMRLCSLRLAPQPALAGLKTLNRLEQVLARAEWAADVPQEGLLRDADGRCVSGTMSNVFALCAGRLLTPRLTRCGVAGVMRGALIDAARAAGRECREVELSLEELEAADAILLTNALIGVWPVRLFAGRSFASTGLARDARRWLAL
jgi:4-amino-4-deoxychorismate lyase